MYFKIKHITNIGFAYKRILDTKRFPLCYLQLNTYRIYYFSIYKK